MTGRHHVTAVAILVAGILLLAHPLASAASDLYANLGPGTSTSGIAGRYPIGNYALDQHFSAIKASLTGGIDASGIPAMIAFFLANLLWQITAFVANLLIGLFALAFSLDLVNGSPATGGAGALAPISQAIANLYAHTFGAPWMVVAVLLCGCWAMWRALVQRRYTETATHLATSLVFCLIALAIVARPAQTIGAASTWTNRVSTALLSVTADGSVADGNQARTGASDQLFSLLVLRPWVALDFGGTEHCVSPNTGRPEHDPTSVTVRPLAAGPVQDQQLARQLAAGQQVSTPHKLCINNQTRYAAHFLAYPPSSDDRNREYQAINTARPDKLPDGDPAKADGTYRPVVADKPVTDAMEQGGQYQRLLLALLILLGELGAFLLLGSLALSIVLSQVVVLLLACFSPVALVCGILPGRGHDLFKGWVAKLASYLLRKAAYSLILAVLLAVLAALQDATSGLGWLMAFGLQTMLMWMVFLQRHQLAGQLTTIATGPHAGHDDGLRRLMGLYASARVLTRHRTPTRTHRPTPAAPTTAPTPPPPAASTSTLPATRTIAAPVPADPYVVDASTTTTASPAAEVKAASEHGPEEGPTRSASTRAHGQPQRQSPNTPRPAPAAVRGDAAALAAPARRRHAEAPAVPARRRHSEVPSDVRRHADPASDPTRLQDIDPMPLDAARERPRPRQPGPLGAGRVPSTLTSPRADKSPAVTQAKEDTAPHAQLLADRQRLSQDKDPSPPPADSRPQRRPETGERGGEA